MSSFAAETLCPSRKPTLSRAVTAADLLNHLPRYLRRATPRGIRSTWEGRPRRREGSLGPGRLTKAHFSGLKSYRETSLLATVGCVCDIISSKQGLCKCPSYKILHISVVFIYGQECSVFFYWLTAISPSSVSRATGLPWPTH